MSNAKLFKHDCESCIYLGTAAIYGHPAFDIYFHRDESQNDTIHGTLILRDGDNPEDNDSMPINFISIKNPRYMLAVGLLVRHFINSNTPLELHFIDEGNYIEIIDTTEEFIL